MCRWPGLACGWPRCGRRPGVTSGMAHFFPFNSPLCLPHSLRPGSLAGSVPFLGSLLHLPGLARSSDTHHCVSSPSWVSLMPLLPLVGRAGSSPFLTCASSRWSWRVGGACLPVSNGGVAGLQRRPLTNQASGYSSSWVFPCFESSL